MSGQPFGLDFGAVMLMAQARGTDLALLSEVLPAIEAAILTGREAYDEGGGDE